MSEKATITAMREWLKTCPLIAEEQGENGRSLPYLWTFPGAGGRVFHRGQPHRSGDGCFLFRPQPRQELHLHQPPRLQRGPERPDRQQRLFEQLTEWVLAQNDRHHLPRLGGRKEPLRVSVTSSGYIVTASAGSCKMQMQLRLEYYQPKG